jgi:hypothetical protein
MRYLLFPLLLALVACDPQDSTPARTKPPSPATAAPRPAPLVSALPPAPDGRTLRFRLTAPPDHPLYLDNCNGAFSWGLEREVAGVWTPAWIVATDACHSAPIVLPPGEFRVFEEAITLGAGERLPAASYRIAVYGLYSTHERSDHAANTEVPHALRVSARFAFGPLPAR